MTSKVISYENHIEECKIYENQINQLRDKIIELHHTNNEKDDLIFVLEDRLTHLVKEYKDFQLVHSKKTNTNNLFKRINDSIMTSIGLTPEQQAKIRRKNNDHVNRLIEQARQKS